MNQRKWVIYTLRDPRCEGIVRYVGATHDMPAKRLARHLSCARRKALYHSSKWILSLVREGLLPVLRVVQEGFGVGWEEAERHWISHYRGQGSPLTNHADGGRGPVGCIRSQETREKLAAANRGKRQSPELVARRISAIRGKRHSAAARARMSAGRKGRTWSPVEAVVHSAIRANPEWRARVSATNKETYARRKAAGLVKTRAGVKASEETRERLRLSHQGKLQSSETRAKRSASLKAAWARRKAVEQME